MSPYFVNFFRRTSNRFFMKMGLRGVALLVVLALGAWSFLGKNETAQPSHVNQLSRSSAVGTQPVLRGESGTPARDESGLAIIQLAELPPQGQSVYAKITRPNSVFRHEKDGSVFNNFERLLPQRKRGYYREYTVETPGLRHRGAKRIVCGGTVQHQPDACYYTEDHYDSFKLIAAS